MFFLLYETFPISFQIIHIVNQNWIVHTLMSIIWPFLSPKIQKRVNLANYTLFSLPKRQLLQICFEIYFFLFKAPISRILLGFSARIRRRSGFARGLWRFSRTAGLFKTVWNQSPDWWNLQFIQLELTLWLISSPFKSNILFNWKCILYWCTKINKWVVKTKNRPMVAISKE